MSMTRHNLSITNKPPIWAGLLQASGLSLPAVFLLAAFACTALENITAFDSAAQGTFFQNGEWLLSKKFHGEYKWLLYTGPKVLISVIGGGFFILFLASIFARNLKKRLMVWKKPALLVLLSVIVIPSTVFLLKTATGVYSPVDLLPYGGEHPHIGMLEQLWTYGKTAGGRSFPAGHASGGFALMALYFLPVRKNLKRILLVVGFLAGWGMGLYQMARGEHFLSHTLTTMFLALAVITFFEQLLRTPNK